jgi:hypothetical protein
MNTLDDLLGITNCHWESLRQGGHAEWLVEVRMAAVFARPLVVGVSGNQK